MFNYEHSSDQKIRSGYRFEKPNIPFPRNPVQFLRRPFPQLRRRMMSGRYPNVGFRPIGHPVFRPDCPNPHGRTPDFRYPGSPNSAIRMASPVAEIPLFPAAAPTSAFENRSQQHPPLRPTLISYPSNPPAADCSERKPSLNELNSFCDVWVEALAPNGRKYYYNARTRVTAWERPMHVRIIDLNEIKRLQNFSGAEYQQNLPTENQNLCVSQQPFNSYGNPFLPRNFPMPPRLMVLPPPQNICNPPQLFPLPSPNHVSQGTTCYKFSPLIPPPVFSVPVINGNVLPNNEPMDHTLSAPGAEGHGDSLQTLSHAYNANDEFRSNENKVSDWAVSDAKMSIYMHINESQETLSEEKSSAVKKILHESDDFISENDNGSTKPEVSPHGETEYSGEVPPCQTGRLSLEQPVGDVKGDHIDESRIVSSTHIAGTNWYVISSGNDKVYYFDSLRKVAVWEKPDELTNRFELNEKKNAPKDENNAVVEKGLESDNCKSENCISSSKPEETTTNDSECLSAKQAVESKKDDQVDKTRPVSSTPVSGTSWFIVWTGDERVFYFDSQHKISVWERPDELMNRSDVDKLIQISPLSQDLKSLKKEVRKIESSGSDTIKKLKKEDESDDTDLSVNMESQSNQIKEEPNMETISHEQKVKIFCEMLAEKKVSAFSTWEKELHKIVFDSRYLLLPSKERKQVFETYISNKVEEEKNDRRKELHQQKENFTSLLKEAGITSKSRFSDLAQRYGKDVRFKAIEKIKQKESIFNQYISELVKKERELERLKAERKKYFLELLREQNLVNTDVTWPKIQANISEDERYKAIQSNSLKEKIFNEYMKGKYSNSVSKEKEDRIHASIRNREEEVKRDLSVHLKDRERERDLHKQMSAISDFKALLNDLIRNPDISWHSAKKMLKEDHRWGLVQRLESENREELFKQHIDLLNGKKREQFHRMLDEIPNFTLKTSWLEVRKNVLNDQRCSKFSSNERKCEKEFKEYLKQKFLAARADFKELLQETKIITHKSKSLLKDTNHLNDIEEILSQDKRYLNLECVPSERKEIILSYIDKLQENGPPPPPTASDSLNRQKNSKYVASEK